MIAHSIARHGPYEVLEHRWPHRIPDATPCANHRSILGQYEGRELARYGTSTRRSSCASPKSPPHTIRLTAGSQLTMLRAMRRIVQTAATIPLASSGRRDLLFELLALHHQLRVL